MLTIAVLATSIYSVTAKLSGEGYATFYGDATDEAKQEWNPFSDEMLGACGDPLLERDVVPPNNYKDYYMALNGAQFDPETPLQSYGYNTWANSLCGECVQVTYPELNTTTTVYLTDSCPACSYGDVDLSLAAFSDLVGSSEQAYHIGRMHVIWEAVPCPEAFPQFKVMSNSEGSEHTGEEDGSYEVEEYEGEQMVVDEENVMSASGERESESLKSDCESEDVNLVEEEVENQSSEESQVVGYVDPQDSLQNPLESQASSAAALVVSGAALLAVLLV